MGFIDYNTFCEFSDSQNEFLRDCFLFSGMWCCIIWLVFQRRLVLLSSGLNILEDSYFLNTFCKMESTDSESNRMARNS